MFNMFFSFYRTVKSLLLLCFVGVLLIRRYPPHTSVTGIFKCAFNSGILWFVCMQISNIPFLFTKYGGGLCDVVI